MISSPFPPGSSLVAYLRDSGHEDQELSIDQQAAAVRAWCAERQLLLTHLYIDNAPGSSLVGRDQFLAMIDHFRKGAPELGIIVWKFSRFARDIDDAQFYKADLRRRGYIVHSLNDAVPTGLDGRFFEAAIDWMNSRYLEDLRMDIKRGQHKLVTDFGALGGVPPKGFKREEIQLPAHRDGRPHTVARWVPDPAQIEIVREAFSLRATGHSYRQINQITRLFGSLNAYNRFYANEIYIGRLKFGDQVIDGYCEAIIDPATWQTVQQYNLEHGTTGRMRGPRNLHHPRRVASTYILTGLLICARCGAPVNGDSSTVHKKSGKDYHYTYYLCTNAHKKGGCTAPKIPAKSLEMAVLKTLREVALDPVMVEARHLDALTHQVELHADLSHQRAKLQAKLTRLQTRIDNTVDLLTDQGRKSPKLLAKLEQLEADELQLRSQIAALDTSSDLPTLTEAQTDAARARDILATTDEKTLQEILQGLVASILVERVGPQILGVVKIYEPPSVVSTNQCPRRTPTHTHNYIFTFQIKTTKIATSTPHRTASITANTSAIIDQNPK